MDEVLYYYGTLAAYNAIAVKDPNALYFITDKGMVFKGATPVATTRGACMGTCQTPKAERVKVCEVGEFPLGPDGKPLPGTIIGVRFKLSNTANSPQLDVNGTGAADIWYNTGVYTSNGAVGGTSGRYVYYAWDGTYWAFVNWGVDNNATYAQMTDEAMRAGTETTGRTVSAKLLKDNFDIQGRTIVMRDDSVEVPMELEWEELEESDE